MQSHRFPHLDCTSMKRGLVMVEAWNLKSEVLSWSAFATAYHQETCFVG